jgi:hypothetical protein
VRHCAAWISLRHSRRFEAMRESAHSPKVLRVASASRAAFFAATPFGGPLSRLGERHGRGRTEPGLALPPGEHIHERPPPRYGRAGFGNREIEVAPVGVTARFRQRRQGPGRQFLELSHCSANITCPSWRPRVEHGLASTKFALFRTEKREAIQKSSGILAIVAHSRTSR